MCSPSFYLFFWLVRMSVLTKLFPIMSFEKGSTLLTPWYYLLSRKKWGSSEIPKLHKADPYKLGQMPLDQQKYSWCSFVVFNCNKRLEISTLVYLASTFSLWAVSSTDKNHRKRSTRSMIWQNTTFTFDVWKLKDLLRKPLSSFLPQAPPSWCKPPSVILQLAKRS